MKSDAQAVFVIRPNRFLALVDLEGVEDRVKVHVHDPGRLEELLYPGNPVLIKREPKPGRKTKWDLLAARKGKRWVFVHSGYHRVLAERILADPDISPLGKVDDVRPEVTFGGSRLDFLVSRAGGETVLEVKGCTLAQDNVALFPDAPTARGKRHLEELTRLKVEGYDAAVVFLVFARGECFAPNTATDPDFSQALVTALEQGVEAHALGLEYGDGVISYRDVIPLCLGKGIKNKGG